MDGSLLRALTTRKLRFQVAWYNRNTCGQAPQDTLVGGPRGHIRLSGRRSAPPEAPGVPTGRAARIPSPCSLAGLRRVLRVKPAPHQRPDTQTRGRPGPPRAMWLPPSAPPHHVQPVHPTPVPSRRPRRGRVRQPHDPSEGYAVGPWRRGRRGLDHCPEATATLTGSTSATQRLPGLPRPRREPRTEAQIGASVIRCTWSRTPHLACPWPRSSRLRNEMTLQSSRGNRSCQVPVLLVQPASRYRGQGLRLCD